MKFSLLKTISLTLCTLLMGACSSDEPGDPDHDKKVTTNRTILVYMVASNSLGSGNFDKADIAEMSKAAIDGALEGNRLILFHQNTSGAQVLKEIDPKTGEVIELETFDSDLSAVSSERMTQVINRTKEIAPANDYGIVLWSHANGWLISNATPEARSSEYSVMPLSFGEESVGGKRLNMNTEVLAQTLSGKNFSFIYFDCCYMACVEVLYDLIGVTDYVVASTAEVIAEGMPYQISLPYLFAKGKADLSGAANAVFNYVNSKTDSDRTGTFAVFDMSKIPDLAVSAKNFYSFHPVTSSDFKPQRYMYESTCYFFDLTHILENMYLPEGNDNSEAFEKARTDYIKAVDASIVYKDCTPYIWPGERFEIKIDNFCGMSSNYVRSKEEASLRDYTSTAWWNEVAKYQFE